MAPRLGTKGMTFVTKMIFYIAALIALLLIADQLFNSASGFLEGLFTFG